MSTQEEHKRTEGARTKAATAGAVLHEGRIGGDWKFQKSPAYLAARLAVWDELYKAQEQVYQGK